MRALTALRVLTIVFFTVSARSQALPEGPGKDLVETICTACHSLVNITAQQKSKEEWQAKVTEMLQEEADVTAPERETIVKYLATHFPKVGAPPKINVNKATAKDLETSLEVSIKDAEAIVHYREDQGNFKTIEELKKVPGLDSAKIEAQKDRLEF